jgi:hypothetical protein
MDTIAVTMGHAGMAGVRGNGAWRHARMKAGFSATAGTQDASEAGWPAKEQEKLAKEFLDDQWFTR